MSEKTKKLNEILCSPVRLMTPEFSDKLNQAMLQGIECTLKDERIKYSIEDLSYNQDTGVGVISVDGLLLYDDYNFAYGGVTSYQQIIDSAETMLKAGAKILVLDIDSGGGFAYGMMESGSMLRELADQYQAKVISYNDGITASAAYGIGSVAHEFVSNPEASTGSIGVVVALENASEYYKKLGVEYTFITAGKGKVPYDDEGNFTKEYLDDVQSKVDSTYERFTQHVSQYRNLSQGEVKGLGAKVYEAQDALSVGLIDKIMTREEFFNYLADLSVDGGEEKMSLTSYIKNKQDKNMSNETVDLKAALQESKDNLKALESDFNAKLESQVQELAKDFEAKFEKKLSEKEAELAQALEALKQVELQKKEAKQKERLAELTSVVGDSKAKDKAEKLADVSDEVFATFMDMIKETKAQSENSELMTELGDEGNIVVTEKIKTRSETIAASMDEYIQKQINKKGNK